MPPKTGQYSVNTNLFRRGGTLFSRGYIARVDIPELGIKAGDEVSRRRAITISRRVEQPQPPPIQSFSPQGVARVTGKFTVDPTLFKPGGLFQRGYIALRDFPEYGVAAGQAVSRRKAIQISQGGVRLEELVQPLEMNARRESLLELWKTRYGTKRGFRRFLAEMDKVHPTTERGLPLDRSREVADAWEEVMRRYDLWDTYEARRDEPLGRKIWDSDPTLFDFLTDWDFDEGTIIEWE